MNDIAIPDRAPSELRTSTPVLMRSLGSAALFLFVCGAVTIAAHVMGYVGGPLTRGQGYTAAALGLFGMLLHALRDDDEEVRRLYGGFATAFLLAGLVFALLPGKSDAAMQRTVGFHLLPWGAGFGLIALLFYVPYARHETEPGYRKKVLQTLLGTGTVLSFGSVAAGIGVPDFLPGPGLVLSLLGTAYIAAYLGETDASSGMGRKVAVGLGILGAATILYAVARSIVPTVLHEGPNALLTPLKTRDRVMMVARGMSVIASLGFASLALFKSWHSLIRLSVALVGFAFAAVFLLGSFQAPMTQEPASFLLPSGLILGFMGTIYLAVALGATSDDPFSVMVRRELTAYFYSPVAYFALIGMAHLVEVGYYFFVAIVLQSHEALPEPIIAKYFPFNYVMLFAVIFLVPLLTMRLLSEERRSGGLELLLTSPVSETSVVLSKFFAGWLMFLLATVPLAVPLLFLRVHGGEPFDYLPVLSYYLAMASSAASFVAMGLFFSSLTSSSIAAAMLTCAAMTLQIFAGLFAGFLRSGDQDPLMNALMMVAARFDFFRVWSDAMSGQLSVQDVVVHLSLASFWLFMTQKVLEVRKWS